MQLAERQKAFENAVKKHFGFTKRTRMSQAFGVSNSAKVIEGGIQLGVPNLDKWAPDDVDGYVLLCVIRFPPEDEVYFAIQVRSGLPKLSRRLADMRRLGEAKKNRPDAEAEAGEAAAWDDEGSDDGELEYSARNNLAVAYLAQDGKLYFRNKGFWASLKFDRGQIGPAVDVDGIAVAIYPPDASARRSMLAREFVGYLGKFVGREKVRELEVWPDAMAVGEAMRRMPHTLEMADIRQGIEDLGGYYGPGVIERFHEALNFHQRKHFVILSGLSGTGKTQLALQYAYVVHGLKSVNEPDPLLRICPVRPDWTDPTGLTGYHDMLTNTYVVPAFLEAVLLAIAHRDSPVFVVLDEMNLARVEYYFAEILSGMEIPGGRIPLHSNRVPIEGSIGGEIRAEIPFPTNLYLIGTVNVDESTNPISDKVLDRASVIDMSYVDLEGFLNQLADRGSALKASIDALRGLLTALNSQLLPNSCGFGYRVAEEIVGYHAFATRPGGRATEQVIDDLLAQKVLVKLKGGHSQRTMLSSLKALLGGYPRSSAVLQQMIDDLDELGSFRFGR